MADTPPLLVVTEVGLAAASVATPTGPYVHIEGFRIGSAFGYTPSPTDTNINGSLLYEGVPTAYRYIGNNTLDVILKIPPEVGPFEFGEVTLDLAGPVMFAKAVFETPQLKYSNLGSNVISTYTFHALIKLAQSTAIFQVDTITGEPPSILEYDLWSDVVPAAQSANPEVPALLIKELDYFGNSTLLTKATDQKWSIASTYALYGEPRVIAGGTLTSILIPKASFEQVMSDATDRGFVIEYGVAFRSVSSVTDAGANWQFNLNPLPLASVPVAGGVAQLYRGGPDSFASLVDVPKTSATQMGVGLLGNGMNVSSPGTISANGLLHNGLNTGRFLTASDNLDFITPGQPDAGGHWPSGLYTVGFDGIVQGGPAGATTSAMVEIVNTLPDVPGSLGVVTQKWYPAAANSQNQNAYFRSLLQASGQSSVWTPWRRMSIAPATSGGLTRVAVPNVLSYTMPADRIGYYTLVRYEPASGPDITSAQLVLNGVQVCVINVPPDNTSVMYPLQLNPGDVVTVTGDIGTIGLNTTAYVMLYPEGVTTWG